MDTNKLRNCAYTILDNAQAIMMECNRDNPYGGYLLEKIRVICGIPVLILRRIR